MKKKRSKFKTKRQYKEESLAKQQAEARERRRQVNIEHLTRIVVKSSGKKIKPLEKPKPWRPDQPKYPSLNDGVEPIRTVKRTVKYDGEMAEREVEAQKEIEAKKKRVAPLFNKGGYQFITDGTDPKDIGRKTSAT